VKFQVLEKGLRRIKRMELEKGIFTKEELLERVRVVALEKERI
jgi:hypothetical protein